MNGEEAEGMYKTKGIKRLARILSEAEGFFRVCRGGRLAGDAGGGGGGPSR